MSRWSRDSTGYEGRADQRPHGEEIAASAPPQREPNDLKYSEDLGGVVNPHDDDLIDSAGWSSWSSGERLAALAAVVLVLAVLAAVGALVVL